MDKGVLVLRSIMKILLIIINVLCVLIIVIVVMKEVKLIVILVMQLNIDKMEWLNVLVWKDIMTKMMGFRKNVCLVIQLNVRHVI